MGNGAWPWRLPIPVPALQRIGSPARLRVWRARFAGPSAGKVIVSVEWAGMLTFANDDKKTAADADHQAWLKGLDRLRKVLSDSLYEEQKPWRSEGERGRGRVSRLIRSGLAPGEPVHDPERRRDALHHARVR